MKNIINKLVFGSLTVALSSCIGNYENINSNPYEAPDLSADGYALGSAMNNLAGCVVSPDVNTCLLYTSPSPRDRTRSRMPSSA